MEIVIVLIIVWTIALGVLLRDRIVEIEKRLYALEPVDGKSPSETITLNDGGTFTAVYDDYVPVKPPNSARRLTPAELADFARRRNTEIQREEANRA